MEAVMARLVSNPSGLPALEIADRDTQRERWRRPSMPLSLAIQLQALTDQHIVIRDGKAVITDTAA
jgi:hypothetical protein